MGLRLMDDDASKLEVLCDCGAKVTVTSARDQQMLSRHTFIRLRAASNHIEHCVVTIFSGISTEITFQRPFDFLCKVFLTPDAPVAVKESPLGASAMTLLSSTWIGKPPVAGPVTVSWWVYGLVDVDDMPPWYVHFYAAITHLTNRFYKAALLDYAVSFETFVEAFLKNRLAQVGSPPIAEYLLKRTWRVESRCKELLELATGHRLSERSDVYLPWKEFVQEPRNRLAHGERVPVDEEAAQKAHDAVYQAIRWIESISG